MGNFVCAFILLFCFTSCLNNSEIGNGKDVNPESIYFDYKIWAEEGRDATVMLQYRFGGENGTTLVFEEPAKVELDGTELKVDSAKLTGAFYEAVKPLPNFVGGHTIVFTDMKGQEHKERFQFEPFSLAAEFGEKVKKEPFTIKLKNIGPEPVTVHLVVTDTSFVSKDINEEILIKKGEIPVTEEMLANLEKGPVTLEIYTEEKRPLKNGTKEGGRIWISYGLKRQFEFVE